MMFNLCYLSLEFFISSIRSLDTYKHKLGYAAQVIGFEKTKAITMCPLTQALSTEGEGCTLWLKVYTMKVSLGYRKLDKRFIFIKHPHFFVIPMRIDKNVEM